MSEEIEPCPFCGGTTIAPMREYEEVGRGQCADCGAAGPIYEGEENFREAWNRRIGRQARSQAVRHVLQQHSRGCSAAVVAMLTGHDYDAIREALNPGADWNAVGVYFQDVVNYLTSRGFTVECKKRFAGEPRRERSPWPPVPFSDVHLCEVRVTQGAPCYHFVIWLRDGTVLDPLTTERRTLADYHEVANVSGVYRIAGPQSDRLVFLDMDGVLNDHVTYMANSYCGVKPACVAEFNRLLRATGAKIVLSTAWRYMVHGGAMTLKGFEYLLLTHGVDAHERVIGLTPTDEERPGWNRGEQIRHWMNEHGDGRHYVVLDDLETLGIREAGHPFVITEGDIGLTAADVDEAIAILMTDEPDAGAASEGGTE